MKNKFVLVLLLIILIIPICLKCVTSDIHNKYNEPVNSNTIQITDDNYEYLCPSLTYDGKNIVYISNESEDGYYQVWMMEIDGINHTQLTFESYNHSFPSFSLDNKKIIFVRSNLSLPLSRTIILMDIDSKDETVISYGNYPCFNPIDNSKIIYLTDKEGKEIFPNSTSSILRQVLCLFDLNTKQTEILKIGIFKEYYTPKFNKNGSQIIYSYSLIMGLPPGPGIKILFVENKTTYEIIPSSIYSITSNKNPLFTYDNRYITFLKDGDIYLMNIYSKNQTLILDEKEPIEYISLSPDGTKLLYTIAGDIWVIDFKLSEYINFENLDSDNDGFTDKDERMAGTDPFDPDDYPKKDKDDEKMNYTVYAVLLVTIILILIILFIISNLKKKKE